MLRTDLWVAAFVRRHNDIGHICVIARHGDPIAGQIFIVLDHLNGTQTLFGPAPATARVDGDADRIFVRVLEAAEPVAVRERLAREDRFDPDFWVVDVEMRGGDIGVTLAK